MSFKLLKQDKKIRQEEVEIQVVERKKQIQIQEQEIIRKELELDATVKKNQQLQNVQKLKC